MSLLRTAPPLADALPEAAAPAALTVYFDGACPVCSREVAMYQRQPGAQACAWVDAAGCAPQQLGDGLSRSDALARFHVRTAEGRLLQGADAFAALWSSLPRWRWLGRLASSAPVRPLAALAYALFLRLRPLWRPASPAAAGADAATATAAPAAAVATPWPTALEADLRSDHAGEAGAVQIYRAIAQLSRDPAVCAMAAHHQATEAEHLRVIEGWLPPAQRSRLLPAWRLAGWLTGALPALLGPRAVAATIAAVETFVDQHYAQQLARIDQLAAAPAADARLPALRRALATCHADELQHRDEALALLAGAALPAWLRAWTWLVGAGSAAAVGAARRF